jgi:hypothetical protein
MQALREIKDFYHNNVYLGHRLTALPPALRALACSPELSFIQRNDTPRNSHERKESWTIHHSQLLKYLEFGFRSVVFGTVYCASCLIIPPLTLALKSLHYLGLYLAGKTSVQSKVEKLSVEQKNQEREIINGLFIDTLNALEAPSTHVAAEYYIQFETSKGLRIYPFTQGSAFSASSIDEQMMATLSKVDYPEISTISKIVAFFAFADADGTFSQCWGEWTKRTKSTNDSIFHRNGEEISTKVEVCDPFIEIARNELPSPPTDLMEYLKQNQSKEIITHYIKQDLVSFYYNSERTAVEYYIEVVTPKEETILHSFKHHSLNCPMINQILEDISTIEYPNMDTIHKVRWFFAFKNANKEFSLHYSGIDKKDHQIAQITFVDFPPCSNCRGFITIINLETNSKIPELMDFLSKV